jgi:hypothetical protein
MPSLPGVPASQARIFIDEFELTQQSSGAEFNAEMETYTYNIMGDATVHQEIGAGNYSIPHRGYYTGRTSPSPITGYFEEVLQSRLGTTLPVIVTLVLGPIAYTLKNTWNSQLTIDAPVDGLITIEGNWASPDTAYRDLVLVNQQFTDLQAVAGIDGGAVAAAYRGFVIHVGGFPAVVDANNVKVTIATSATAGGTYVDWLGVQTFDVPGAIIVLGTPNPNRYFRVTVDFTTPGIPGPVDVFVALIYA